MNFVMWLFFAVLGGLYYLMYGEAVKAGYEGNYAYFYFVTIVIKNPVTSGFLVVLFMTIFFKLRMYLLFDGLAEIIAENDTIKNLKKEHNETIKAYQNELSKRDQNINKLNNSVSTAQQAEKSAKEALETAENRIRSALANERTSLNNDIKNFNNKSNDLEKKSKELAEHEANLIFKEKELIHQQRFLDKQHETVITKSRGATHGYERIKKRFFELVEQIEAVHTQADFNELIRYAIRKKAQLIKINEKSKARANAIKAS